MVKSISFETRIEAFQCLNTRVLVEGTDGEGVRAVFALGEHGGAEITDSLPIETLERLDSELRLEIAERLQAEAENRFTV